MYCPNCGQQQISDETRFCSRCGLAIAGLAEWIAAGGLPAARTRTAPAAQPAPLTRRRRGIRRGGKLMFAGGVMVPIFGILSGMADHPAPMIAPFIVFFAGLVMMIYSRLFLDNVAPVDAPPAGASHLRSAAPQAGALPHASPDMWVPTAGPARTSELVAEPPPSVTEHTTRHLDKQ